MPTNKNASIRYRVLDRCFRNPNRRYYIEDLMSSCEFELQKTISRRQIYADMEYMREDPDWQAPIEAYDDGYHRKYYRYSDCDYSIFKQALSADEVEKLREAILMLNRLKWLPNTEWLDEFTSRLEDEFGDFNRTESVMSFQNNEFLKGLEHLTPLFEAIIHKKVLNIKYKPFSKNTIDYCIHPYYLKQYNNRWFLFGWDNNKQYMPTIAIDRIESINVNENEEFVPNSTIKFNEYFDDVVGVTITDKPIEKILLKFDKERFPYVKSKPLHGSQKIKDNEQGIVEIMVKPNNELEAQIFSYGPQVEVLEPLWLRQQIEKKVEETLKKYSSVKKDCTIEH